MNDHPPFIIKYMALSCVMLWLSACGGGGSGTGMLSLSVTDAPVVEDVDVCIHFTGITLHHADGDLIRVPYDPASYYNADDGCSGNVPLDDPHAVNNAVDLSSLQGELSVSLMDALEVKAGRYNWIRLDVDESLSYVVDSLGQQTLRCPSCAGEQSGLKLNRGLTVPAGGEAAFMIDINLAKALNKGPTGDYKLRPTLRLVDMTNFGRIKGTIAGSLIPEMISATATGCKVYAYAGHDITPDDYHPADNVLASASVLYDAGSATYQYHLAYLPTDVSVDPTPYTVALTCDDDDPEVDQDNTPVTIAGDAVIFSDGSTGGAARNADVYSGHTTRVNFPSEI